MEKQKKDLLSPLSGDPKARIVDIVGHPTRKLGYACREWPAIHLRGLTHKRPMIWVKMPEEMPMEYTEKGWVGRPDLTVLNNTWEP